MQPSDLSVDTGAGSGGNILDLVLGARSSWSLTEASVQGDGVKLVISPGGCVHDAEPVQISVDLQGDRYPCPYCMGGDRPVVAHRTVNWRYIAPLGAAGRLSALVPIVHCPGCGEHQVAPPWSGQPGYVQLDGLSVASLNVSPRQYRYAFKDLQAGLPDEDAAILQHYHGHGRAELESGRRPIVQNRIQTVALQNLSSERWGEAPSPYFKLVVGESRTLDIVFSYTFIPEGQFQLDTVASPNTILFLNTRGSDFYQRGLPGVTSSIADTASWLRKVVAHLGAESVRTHGSSMGGYAALLFGYLLDATAIYTTAPLVRLGDLHCRSWEWYRERVYDPQWRDLTSILPSIIDRSRIMFPVDELFEFTQVSAFEEAGLDKLYFAHGRHPGMEQMAWDRVLGTPDAIGFSDGIAAADRYTLRYGTNEIAQINEAYEAIRAHDHPHAVSLLLGIAAVDPNNFGVLYRLGVHQELAGDQVGALQHLRQALTGMWETKVGFDASSSQLAWRAMIMEDYSHILPLAQQKKLNDLFPLVWTAAERGDSAT